MKYLSYFVYAWKGMVKNMKCNYCGTELGNNVKFCAKCGKPVVKNETPIRPTNVSASTDFGEKTLIKTQVSILVRKESLYSELRWKLIGHPFLWFLYIFEKPSGVNIWIDKGSENERYMELKQQKEPYMIELESGYHEIVFADSNADSKGSAGAVTRVMAGAAAGLVVHELAGIGGADTFCNIMDATAGSTIRDGFASFTLQSGDVYELICRPTRKGGVKLWERKK